MKLYAGAIDRVLAPRVADTQALSGSAVAPAGAAVIVDTGPLAAGVYEVAAALGVSDTAAVGRGLVVELRDAANATTVSELAYAPAGVALFVQHAGVNLTVANQRVRVITTAAGAASSIYKAWLGVKVL